MDKKISISQLKEVAQEAYEEAARLRVHPLIWGCDFCQRACPYNAAPARSPLPEFSTSLVDALENSDLEGLTIRTLMVFLGWWWL